MDKKEYKSKSEEIKKLETQIRQKMEIIEELEMEKFNL